MIPLMAALQFLLVSPAFIRRQFTQEELGKAVAYFPVVGMLLGGLLAAADRFLALIFPVQVAAALVLALWITLTGGLHMDGWIDACDGLFGGDTPERRMEIMRDHRAGAFGVAGAALLLLVMYGALTAMGSPRWIPLLLAPTAGRCAMSLCVVALPYARGVGLGTALKDGTRVRHAAAALMSTLVLTGFLWWAQGSALPVLALCGAAVVAAAGAAFAVHRVGGMTGDLYGAINMLVEATVLIIGSATP